MSDTPLRSVRIPDDLWDDVRQVCEVRGETASEVVRRSLQWYVDDHRAGQ